MFYVCILPYFHCSIYTGNHLNKNTCALLGVLVVARLQHELLEPPSVERVEEVQGLFLLVKACFAAIITLNSQHQTS